ncbi:hypothetical protein QL285_046215 [Trifolium repens]|nr:hypothetical protein QL285_046215 [Trifolium repens]
MNEKVKGMWTIYRIFCVNSIGWRKKQPLPHLPPSLTVDCYQNSANRPSVPYATDVYSTVACLESNTFNVLTIDCCKDQIPPSVR